MEQEQALKSIRFRTQEKRHYQETDIVLLPDTDEIKASVIISAEITEAAHVMEICRRHKLEPQESRQKYARLFLRTRAGGVVALSGRYAIKAIQTVIWDYAATVRLEYVRACLRLSEPPESEKWNGYGLAPVNPAQWFIDAAQIRPEGKPLASEH